MDDTKQVTTGATPKQTTWSVPILDPLVRVLEGICTALAGTAIVLMMLLTTLDSLLRYFVGAPLTGVTEVITLFLMVGAVWLSMASTERSGGHVSIDLVVRRAPAAVGRWATLITRLASTWIVGIICWVTFYKTVDSWDSWTTGVIRLPLGPSWALVTVGSGLLTARLLLEVVQDVAALVFGFRRNDLEQGEPR